MATIDTNMSLVMIDPNEPLELYDGTIIKGRLEWFLYALCCLDYGNLPTPLSRIEEWANALITNELPNMEPQSRAEEFFKAILTGDTSNLPTPQSRSEVLLDKLARGENDFTNVEKIQSRYEFLLAYLIKNGGGIGNIDYVLYKFQKEDETLYNTKERPVKSAILKGQTLVNLFDGHALFSTSNVVTTYDEGVYTFRAKETYEGAITPSNMMTLKTTHKLELNKKYTLFITQLSGNPCRFGVQSMRVDDKNSTNQSILEPQIHDGIIRKLTFTLTSDYSELRLRLNTYQTEQRSIQFKEIMIIEGDYTNVDIPYFEGMQSVKMPVLTTVGKNLFDGGLEKGNISSSNGLDTNSDSHMRSKNYINVEPNKVYVFSINTSDVKGLRFYDNNKNFISASALSSSFTTPSNCKYIRFIVSTSNPDLEIQIEKNFTSTAYEPYKSNILSTPEDLELHGIGNVKDELNVATGELTQRIKEVVLDGSDDEVWSFGEMKGDNYKFGLNLKTDVYGSGDRTPILSDKIAVGNLQTELTQEQVMIYNHTDYMELRLTISPNKLTSNTGQALKDYLKANPFTIQYALGTPVVKTVDLSIVDQGGATIPKLNTFDKITHVNVSATDILPEVEMEVATTIGEDLSGTLYSTMEDIETKQEVLKESNNAQTESVNSTMMATTEIYESLL